MKISLIGMSGIGKSHWSKKLARQGFTRYCCDDLIEIKLEQKLKNVGFSGTRDVSKWLGQPFEPQYEQNSKLYLDFEKEVMTEILDELESNTGSANIVIDTTGSVIYTGEKLLQRLKYLTEVLYLETPRELVNQMYQLYTYNPKPVIWGDMYKMNTEETKLQALQRCYLPFLLSRQKQYAALADKTFSFKLLRQKGFNLLEAISDKQL